MSFFSYIKSNLTKLPYPIGRAVSYIPFDCRPGISGVYKRRVHDINRIQLMNDREKRDFVFSRVKELAVYASKNICFYERLYRTNNVNPDRFRNFDDLLELPIINKQMLQSVELEERTLRLPGAMKVNTGGSSGKPLELFVESSSIGHEWAHMHYIWRNFGFRQHNLKLVFGGRSDVTGGVQYDSVRHQFNVDLYAGWDVVADKLINLFKKHPIYYLHGYPSAIFDFVVWAKVEGHPILSVLKENIQGIFLGSEFPCPVLRSEIERALSCKSVSWYGHTERAILAFERDDKEVYNPFLSYGWGEIIDSKSLVCTSYYNRASPLIRYDTGDLVEGEVTNGILESFKIKNGRAGEFIVDKKSNKIFLTGLIYGRHHPLFEFSKNIQVHQSHPGKAQVLVTPRKSLTINQAEHLFDKRNVDIDFTFKIVEQPVKTASGKTPLLVQSQV